MVRTRSQRAAMLLRLPTDVLFKIASHVVAPDLVVAAGKNLEARTALRNSKLELDVSKERNPVLAIKHAARHELRDLLGGGLALREAAHGAVRLLALALLRLLVQAHRLQLRFRPEDEERSQQGHCRECRHPNPRR